MQYVSTVIDVRPEDSSERISWRRSFIFDWGAGVAWWRKWREGLSASVRGKISVFLARPKMKIENFNLPDLT